MELFLIVTMTSKLILSVFGILLAAITVKVRSTYGLNSDQNVDPVLVRLPYVISPPYNESLLTQKVRNSTENETTMDIFISGEFEKLLNATLTLEKKISEENAKFPKSAPMTNSFCDNSFSTKIIGGNNANSGEFPWQALVQSPNGFCGGVLIHSCYVITAQHCTNGLQASQLIVTLGEYNRNVNEGTEQVRHVIKIFPHPSLDASIVLLDSAAQQNAYVNWIQLADMVPPTGTIATVTGWGWLASGINSVATILQKLSIPIANWNICASQLNPYFPSSNPLQLTDICVGDPSGPYANACHGDSGGPLVVNMNGIWKLIGIVNRGAPGCPASVDYAVYLSIPSIKSWILSHIFANQVLGGSSCKCVQPVTRYDGALVQAVYDGANCYIGPASVGCGVVNPIPNKSFIYQNRFYKSSSKAIECPLQGSSWDTCNCFYKDLSIFPLSSMANTIVSNKFYLGRYPVGSVNCFLGVPVTMNGNPWCLVASAPFGTNAFKYDNKWYTTPRPTCNPPFSFDGANCHWGSIPTNGFIWNNAFYVASGPGNSCSIGFYDGANCFIVAAPWATTAFSWNGNWYHSPRKQCFDGQFDGANCLMMFPPSGSIAFIYNNNLYYGW